MAYANDQPDFIPPPPFVPADQSGLSQAYVRGSEQVGYVPQARWNDANPDNYQTPDSFANADVPSNILDLLMSQENPRDLSFPNRTDRQGIDPGQGGLGRREDTTYMSGDQLSHAALAHFPPNLQELYANRKIDRPADVGELYGPGQKATAGGYYQGADGTIALARGNADAYHDPNVDIGGAQHEILHAIQNEVEPFRSDANQQYPGLKGAVQQDAVALSSHPQTAGIAQKVLAQIKANDWGHVFTELGLAHVNGAPLPPAIRAYFARLDEGRPAGDYHPSDPNYSTPPASDSYQQAYFSGRQMENVGRRNAIQGLGSPTQYGRPLTTPPLR